MLPQSTFDRSRSTPLSAPAVDDCVERAARVLARMQAGGRDVADPSGWRPAQSHWR